MAFEMVDQSWKSTKTLFLTDIANEILNELGGKNIASGDLHVVREEHGIGVHGRVPIYGGTMEKKEEMVAIHYNTYDAKIEVPARDEEKKIYVIVDTVLNEFLTGDRLQKYTKGTATNEELARLRIQVLGLLITLYESQDLTADPKYKALKREWVGIARKTKDPVVLTILGGDEDIKIKRLVASNKNTPFMVLYHIRDAREQGTREGIELRQLVTNTLRDKYTASEPHQNGGAVDIVHY